MSHVPIIASAEDLAWAIRRAERYRETRHYVASRAAALGLPEAIPANWGITAGVVRKVAHAIGGWDASLHPRGRDGKFIEKGGSVDLFEGKGYDKPAIRGEAVGVRKEGNRQILTVRAKTAGSFNGNNYDVGDEIDTTPDRVAAAPDEKARLDGKKPFPVFKGEVKPQGEVIKGEPTDLKKARDRADAAAAELEAATESGDKARITKAKIANTAAQKNLVKQSDVEDKAGEDLLTQLEQSVANLDKPAAPADELRVNEDDLTYEADDPDQQALYKARVDEAMGDNPADYDDDEIYEAMAQGISPDNFAADKQSYETYAGADTLDIDEDQYESYSPWERFLVARNNTSADDPSRSVDEALGLLDEKTLDALASSENTPNSVKAAIAKRRGTDAPDTLRVNDEDQTYEADDPGQQALYKAEVDKAMGDSPADYSDDEVYEAMAQGINPADFAADKQSYETAVGADNLDIAEDEYEAYSPWERFLVARNNTSPTKPSRSVEEALGLLDEKTLDALANGKNTPSNVKAAIAERRKPKAPETPAAPDLSPDERAAVDVIKDHLATHGDGDYGPNGPSDQDALDYAGENSGNDADPGTPDSEMDDVTVAIRTINGDNVEDLDGADDIGADLTPGTEWDEGDGPIDDPVEYGKHMLQQVEDYEEVNNEEDDSDEALVEHADALRTLLNSDTNDPAVQSQIVDRANAARGALSDYADDSELPTFAGPDENHGVSDAIDDAPAAKAPEAPKAAFQSEDPDIQSAFDEWVADAKAESNLTDAQIADRVEWATMKADSYWKAETPEAAAAAGKSNAQYGMDRDRLAMFPVGNPGAIGFGGYEVYHTNADGSKNGGRGQFPNRETAQAYIDASNAGYDEKLAARIEKTEEATNEWVKGKDAFALQQGLHNLDAWSTELNPQDPADSDQIAIVNARRKAIQKALDAAPDPTPADVPEEATPESAVAPGNPAAPSAQMSAVSLSLTNSANNKGMDAPDLSTITSAESVEAAQKALAAEMTRLKLGGKQRARMRQLLDQHWGASGDGDKSAAVSAKATAESLPDDNPLKAKLEAAVAKVEAKWGVEVTDNTGTPDVDSPAVAKYKEKSAFQKPIVDRVAAMNKADALAWANKFGYQPSTRSKADLSNFIIGKSWDRHEKGLDPIEPPSAAPTPAPAAPAAPAPAGVPDLFDLREMSTDEQRAAFKDASVADLQDRLDDVNGALAKFKPFGLGPGAVAGKRRLGGIRNELEAAILRKKRDQRLTNPTRAQVMEDLNDYDPSDESPPNIDLGTAAVLFNTEFQTQGPNAPTYTAKINGTERTLTNTQVRALLDIPGKA